LGNKDSNLKRTANSKLTVKLNNDNNLRSQLTRTPAGNSTYPKVAVQWLNQALHFYHSLCLVDPEASGLRNPPLRQAPNRYKNYKNDNHRDCILLK